MVSVLMATDREDRHFNDTFFAYAQNGAFAGVPELFKEQRGLSHAVRDIEDVTAPVKGKTIIVFQRAAELPVSLIEPDKSVVLVDSSKGELLSIVSASGLPAITCGMSNKDTVTLSSMDDDSAVVDLRRSITGFDGIVIEPQEIPARCKRAPHRFALMAAAAVRLLSGTMRAGKEKSDADALYYH
ncbi:MAG: hypothetical protein LBU86_04490 [Oscillospiraceae bacterium]|nr:hypothetical protein [Oscillospiraceae bacterium]